MEDALVGMLNDICGPDLFNGILETLSINLFAPGGDHAAYVTALRVVKGLHMYVIMPLALMLMFIYFMIAVVEKLSQENFQWEQFFRTLALLLVSKYLIEHALEILEILYGIGMDLAARIQNWSGIADGKTSVTTAEMKEIIKTFREGLGLNGSWTSWLGDLILFIYLLLPWLASWILGLAISVVCYTRVVEIYLRTAFMPVALADFFHHGMQSNGWRSLKSFLAVCLQGGVILVIAIIFSRLMKDLTADTTNMFKFIGAYLAFGASSVMLIFKSLSLTKEFVGAN